MNSVVLADNRSDNLTCLPGWRIPASKPTTLEDCCLIVATYGRPAEVSALMQTLAAMSDVPAELVIVDGSPEDETERALLRLCRNTQLAFELIYVHSPKGLTRQRNAGVDISTRPILFFLDDDALPAKDYFTALRRVFVEDVGATIAAAGAFLMNAIDTPIARRWRIRHALRLIPRCAPLTYNDVGASAPSGVLKVFSGIRDVDIFPGCAFALRREVTKSMRFSEFFAGYSYGEDVEMALRIRRRGRVVHCGDAHVVHNSDYSPSARPAAFAKGRMEVRNRYFIWRRYAPETTILNKIRFHVDLLFTFAMDLGWFLARPWQWHHISHAFGLLAGAASCAMSPPVWDEPAPRLRYCVAAGEQITPGDK
jgi:GT2 family glycosyltransferase